MRSKLFSLLSLTFGKRLLIGGLGSNTLCVLGHDATLVVNVVVSHFDVSSHGRVGNDLTTILRSLLGHNLSDSSGNFDLLHKVGSAPLDVTAGANWDTAAAQDNKEQDAEEKENGTSDEKSALARVKLAALLLVGEETERLHVNAFDIGAKETNHLLICLEFDEYSVILATGGTSTINLTTCGVENNRNDTISVCLDTSILDVLALGQGHRCAHHVRGCDNVTGDSKRENNNINWG